MPDIVTVSNKIETPDARTMILDLFAAYDDGGTTGPVLATREILQIAETLEIAPTAIRTAITRLKQEGRLKVCGRGVYGYGDRADAWRQRIDGWRVALTRRRAWDGAWLIAIVKPSSLPRTLWRATARALDLEGFRRTPSGLWMRPDNLEGLDTVRGRLIGYGASPAMTTARATNLDEASLKGTRNLWDNHDVNASHRHLGQLIEESRLRLDGAASDSAAREALVLGRAGVRAIIRDPLLPIEMWDDSGLQALLAAMLRYETVGKAVWARRFNIPRRES